MTIILKGEAELQLMRDAAVINGHALGAVREALRPGVTTAELDQIAYDVITKANAIPAFLGYPPGSSNPFPATITVTVNEELVHGIPGSRVLEEGDVVSIDCGTIFQGFVADAAYSAGVGEISAEAQHLLDITEKSLYLGIEACVPNNRLGDIGYAIQSFVEGHNMNVVREYGGHGVGRTMHESPHVPNWGKRGRGKRLRAGMTIALEPMVMLGEPETELLDDQWTVITADHSLCAHFEHTVAITENGPEILTKWS